MNDAWAVRNDLYLNLPCIEQCDSDNVGKYSETCL